MPWSGHTAGAEGHLGTQEHGLLERARGHFSHHMLLVQMDWRVINQMPFQGAVENAEIFNEVLWNEIDTYQELLRFCRGDLALFALEFRRTYRENTDWNLISRHQFLTVWYQLLGNHNWCENRIKFRCLFFILLITILSVATLDFNLVSMCHNNNILFS